jgi:hypothetical protein
VYFREPQLFHSIIYHEDEVSEDLKRLVKLLNVSNFYNYF